MKIISRHRHQIKRGEREGGGGSEAIADYLGVNQM